MIIAWWSLFVPLQNNLMKVSSNIMMFALVNTPNVLEQFTKLLKHGRN